jgi:hypothetical protein
VDDFGGSDVLMTRIPILFIIIVITISSLYVVVSPCSVVGSELLGIDVFEEATILHGVIRFGMQLAGTLQGLDESRRPLGFLIVLTSWSSS